eukprot:4315857-Prymnesium_polylepis.1
MELFSVSCSSCVLSIVFLLFVCAAKTPLSSAERLRTRVRRRAMISPESSFSPASAHALARDLTLSPV